MNKVISLDIETIPINDDKVLKRYLQTKISKIRGHGRWKATTKAKKIQKLKDKMREFRAGVRESDFAKQIIKDLSVNPLFNQIVAIGLVYKDVDGKRHEYAKACKDEKELLKWFIDNLEKAETEMFGEVKYGGHNIGFDLDSLRFSLIKHNLTNMLKEKCSSKKGEPILPLKKYDYRKIDTLQLFPNLKLEELTQAVLNEGKIANGSEVYGFYQEDKLDKIEDYVLLDVQLWYDLYKKIKI